MTIIQSTEKRTWTIFNKIGQRPKEKQPYPITHKTCRICVRADGESTCETCGVAIHKQCVQQQIEKEQHHRHNFPTYNNDNNNPDPIIIRCSYCRGKQQEKNRRIKRSKIIQTTIEWQSKQQDEQAPAPRRNTRQTISTTTPPLIAYTGREHQGKIEIYEIEQHKHRHTYRQPPPLHTLRNKRLILRRHIPTTQYAAMTRNPPQHERKQRRAAEGGRRRGPQRRRAERRSQEKTQTQEGRAVTGHKIRRNKTTNKNITTPGGTGED